MLRAAPAEAGVLAERHEAEREVERPASLDAGAVPLSRDHRPGFPGLGGGVDEAASMRSASSVRTATPFAAARASHTSSVDRRSRTVTGTVGSAALGRATDEDGSGPPSFRVR